MAKKKQRKKRSRRQRVKTLSEPQKQYEFTEDPPDEPDSGVQTGHLSALPVDKPRKSARG